MQRRLKQAFACISDGSAGRTDLDRLVIKATSPDDVPMSERYVHEILQIFSMSPLSIRAFSLSFTGRFGKTRYWRVALKCLLLLHRLLRSLPENSQFRSELIWMRSTGLISLFPCHFRDTSSSSSEDYNLFIRAYAQLIDEALDCYSLNNKSQYEELSDSYSSRMKEVGRSLEFLPQIQSLIDRVMDCRPTVSITRSFLVRSAMKHIIRDSFVSYTMFREQIVLVLDNLIQMPYQNCTLAFGIYKKAALQASQLEEFYDWCKGKGLCGSYEYPHIDRIPRIQVQALETFLGGMWQLTESSTSSSSSLSSSTSTTPPSPSLIPSSSLPGDENDRQTIDSMTVVGTTQWEKFDGEETKQLITLEDEENVNWETLLESSVCIDPYSSWYDQQRVNKADGHDEKMDGWKVQIYNPNQFNPFYQPSCNFTCR